MKIIIYAMLMLCVGNISYAQETIIGETTHFKKFIPESKSVSIRTGPRIFRSIKLKAIDADIAISEARVSYMSGQVERLRNGSRGFNLREGRSTTVELKTRGRIKSIRIKAVSSDTIGSKGKIRVYGLQLQSGEPRPIPNPGSQTGHLRRQDISCQWNSDHYGLFSYQLNRWVGKRGYGFSKKEMCELSIRTMRYSLLCNWEGGAYVPYDGRSNIQIGKRGRGFSGHKSCLDTIKNTNGKFLCQWNGSNYQPWFLKTNSGVGRIEHGFNSITNCYKAVKGSRGNLICQWDTDSQYRIINGRTQERVYPYGHRTLNECTEHLRRH